MSKLRDAAQQALEALEWADNAMYEGTPIQANTQKAITALRAALAEQPAEQEPKRDLMWSTVAMQKRHDERIGRIVNTLEQIKQEQLTEQPESLDWVSLNKAADEIVRSKPTWKQFIDGTPLANDIACWMADFALEHTSPQSAKPAEQEPVAWCDQYESHIDGLRHYSDGGAREIPLYLAPQPAKQPLIADEICDSWEFITGHHRIQFGPNSEGRYIYLSPDEVIEFARAIERAHGIGEHE